MRGQDDEVISENLWKRILNRNHVASRKITLQKNSQLVGIYKQVVIKGTEKAALQSYRAVQPQKQRSSLN